MDDPVIHGQGAPQPIRPTTPSGGASSSSRSESGVEFRALLERLEERAAALEADRAEGGDRAELAGAVDRARATFEDALSLSDQLLEAYRESVLNRRDDPNSENPA